MLIVKINEAKFEYDIHSLVKAFYPETEIKVILFEESSSFTSEGPIFTITFETARITMSVNKDALVHTVSLEDADNRPHVKNQLKQLLYRTLSEYTGKELPWGTLTGIRPTKIPMTQLEEGKSEQEILQSMKELYYISDEKGKLSLDIAKRESELLSTIHYKDGYSLYIGIPFCPTTCLYCSFTSYPICIWKNRVDEYLDALEKEIDFIAETLNKYTLGQLQREFTKLKAEVA